MSGRLVGQGGCNAQPNLVRLHAALSEHRRRRGFPRAKKAQHDVLESDPIVYEPATYHNGVGGNVLFGDGHVQFVEARSLNALLARAATRPPSTTPPATTAPAR